MPARRFLGRGLRPRGRLDIVVVVAAAVPIVAIAVIDVVRIPSGLLLLDYHGN